MPRAATTLFEDAIDVPLWLEAERLTPHVERVRRDRAIALEVADGSPVGQVRAWWRSVARDGDPGLGARLDRLRAVVTIAMAALGAVTGGAVALTAFAYDGSEPVNVVRLLALLVGLQLVLLVFTLLLLPGRVFGLRHVQDLLAAFNPGAWAAAVFQKLAKTAPDVARLFDRRAPRAAAVRFAKWQALYWSQTAAVAFNVAALVTAILLVTFSDLAFGWSTTLEADPAAITRGVQKIARPWAALVPAAVPSAELVEQSQFFRLEGSEASASPRALGAWWPFTILALVTYGLAPRLALLALAAARLRAATKRLLLDDAGVTALLDRMRSPEIETAATDVGTDARGRATQGAIAGHDAAPPHEIGVPPTARRPITGDARALVWEDCLPMDAARDYARTHLGLDVTSVAAAGGGELTADHAALERLAGGVGQTLLVFTPAWEPPLLELLDFLAEIRRRAGSAVSIVVAPVPDGPRAVTDVERATWTRAIARLADPRLYVETGTP
jgi:hypothetical protein